MDSWKIGVCLIFLLFQGNAIAGSDVYECEIVNVYKLSETGVLIISNLQSEFKGNRFTVTRSTGSIRGETLTTIKALETKVVVQGSKQYSYKAVAHFEKQIQLIEIQEFKPGTIKPFIASSMGGAGLVTGSCI